MPPRTQYTKSSESSIAYQVLGDGPPDLVYAHGWLSHIEYAWENPDYARFLNRLASFARLIRFDRRGMGLSDREVGSLTLEQRVDDIRAVMDAVNSQKATILGVSEGGYMSVMFAATYPERVAGLVLCGAFAKGSWAPDYPWAPTSEQREEYICDLERNWGGPFDLEHSAPSVAKDAAARSWLGAYLRYSAGLSAAKALSRINHSVDVRKILPAVSVPTLVLHRIGDQWHALAEGQYLAKHIPGAKLVELPGDDHIPWWGDQNRLIGEIQEFITGARVSAPTERVLLTIVVTDIVGSTEKAVVMGDSKWKDLLHAHDAAVRRELKNFEGQEINTTGDGFVLAFTGPTRAIQCTKAIRQNLASLGVGLRAGLHTGECEWRGEDLSGLAVNIASRISNQASSNDILVSNTVKDLVVGSGIKFDERGPRSLKGIPGEWPLFSVVD
jgi:pimeloyl-ACP methyl ester carboxylesterase/class 3 adenylate cyclase